MNILCSKYFMDWSWRHMLQSHVSTIETKHIFAPTLQPFLSTSFYFVKAHFLIFVEYDPYYDSMMDGMIEFDLEMRGFTNGYDFYAPNMNILYSMNHIYVQPILQ